MSEAATPTPQSTASGARPRRSKRDELHTCSLCLEPGHNVRRCPRSPEVAIRAMFAEAHREELLLRVSLRETLAGMRAFRERPAIQAALALLQETA